ncbi:hypothetical protein [Azospirillum oryzae]|uniref:hypothetical protein n=1 Tax=Azospirillum oryzae TaxID=286727 RepID=UPI0011777DDC|nr:hypothetical protein [Azospirillum oryzae]
MGNRKASAAAVAASFQVGKEANAASDQRCRAYCGVGLVHLRMRVICAGRGESGCRFLLKIFSWFDVHHLDESTAWAKFLRLRNFLQPNAFMAQQSTLGKPSSSPFDGRNGRDFPERFRNLPAAGRIAQGYAAASGAGVTASSAQTAAFAPRSCLHQMSSSNVFINGMTSRFAARDRAARGSGEPEFR